MEGFQTGDGGQILIPHLGVGQHSVHQLGGGVVLMSVVEIQERTADGLICKRPAGNTYKIQDDAWALDFYYAHKDDTAAQLVHAVLTNTQMWDQDLTAIPGLEAAVLADLELIRTQGAEAAYKSCL